MVNHWQKAFLGLLKKTTPISQTVVTPFWHCGTLMQLRPRHSRDMAGVFQFAISFTQLPLGGLESPDCRARLQFSATSIPVDQGNVCGITLVCVETPSSFTLAWRASLALIMSDLWFILIREREKSPWSARRTLRVVVKKRIGRPILRSLWLLNIILRMTAG